MVITYAVKKGDSLESKSQQRLRPAQPRAHNPIAHAPQILGQRRCRNRLNGCVRYSPSCYGQRSLHKSWGQHYSAAVEVVNDGNPASLSGFTLYFDETRFTNLSLTGSPSTWNSLLIQPDLGIPAAGFLDAFAIDPLDALQLGQSQGGFNFTFVFIGQGLPGAMAFDINDANYNVLFSGISFNRFVTTNLVPEPGAGWLVLIALVGLSVARHLRTTTSLRTTTYLPRVTA